MDKKKFIDRCAHVIESYLHDSDPYGQDPQLRVNPDSFEVALATEAERNAEIEDSDEAVENAAGARGAATEIYDDFQVTQNSDYYPLRTLIRVDAEGVGHPDREALRRLAGNYLNLK